MEGIDAVFSSDETFFEEAAMFGNNHKTRRRLFESDNKNNTDQQCRRDNHTRDTNDNDEFDEFEFFDPPSKVCGGEFFSKVMATIGSGSGSKNHSKISHGNNSNEKSKSSSSNNTHRKKKHQQQQQQQQHKMQLQLQLQQHPKQQQQQQQLQQDDSSSKLIAKLTNKIMKRRKDNYMGTTTTTIEGTKRNSCIKPAIVMPVTTTATTMSSLSSLEPSVSSSPWATEVDNNFFHHSSASHQPFFNEKMNHQGETAIMGEITDKHINRLRPPQQQQQQQQQPPQKPTQQSPRNRTSASLRDLQSLLEEMNNLNGMVRENSTVLQAGIANIALELQQHHTKDIGGKQSKSQSQSPSQPPIPNPPSKASRNNENLDEGDNCQHRFADENSWGIEENNNHVKKVDNKEIEKLKEERLYYRSETETLRSEMECIKEQLSELRKLLPKKTANSNHDNHPHQQQQQQQPSESPSQQHYPIDDESSVEFPPWSCAYASSSIATSGSSSNISISSAKAGDEDDFASIRNHQYNSHSSDAKMSFRSEIREIINASERSTRSVFERMGVSSDRAEC